VSLFKQGVVLVLCCFVKCCCKCLFRQGCVLVCFWVVLLMGSLFNVFVIGCLSNVSC